MADNGKHRPVPKDLKTLSGILCVHTTVNGCIGSFVQMIFASNLLIGCVVAVVGGCFSPVGTYLTKRATSGLSPKAALILIVFANVFGLGMALVVEHLFVMIWGFVTTSVAIQLLMQYVADFHASIGATEVEKAIWSGQIQGPPVLCLLVGSLLGPCIFSTIWHAQAAGVWVLAISSSALFLLPSPASSKPADAPWRLNELSRELMGALSALTLLAVHNACRDALLGPTVTLRFELDPWAWGQLQFLGALGGVIGMTMTPGIVQQAPRSFTVIVMVLSLLTRVAEHFTLSFSVFMASTFSSAVLKMMLVPLLWKLLHTSPKYAEQMPVLQQVQAVSEGVIGFVVPLSVLNDAFVACGTPLQNLRAVGSIDLNLSRALYFVSGLLLVLSVMFSPASAEEVQIHGEVNLKKHVQRLVAAQKYRDVPKIQRSYAVVVNGPSALRGKYERSGELNSYPLFKCDGGQHLWCDPSAGKWRISDKSMDDWCFSASVVPGVELPPRGGWEALNESRGVLAPHYLREAAFKLKPAPACNKGHRLRPDVRGNHRCDICGTSGTAFRCPEGGCDYDMCKPCYEQTKETCEGAASNLAAEDVDAMIQKLLGTDSTGQEVVFRVQEGATLAEEWAARLRKSR
ncbi:unnamed protein product [Symbiodinium natans]|uniref:Uncharacterized protein n=1 Tax=Symbiodinium natans TaxID=878477 RepID=A0A812IM32_9DINO|nr:unnamed protein product [Symbiodinium natans]